MMLGFGTIIGLAYFFSNHPENNSSLSATFGPKIEDSVYTIPFTNPTPPEPPSQPHEDNPGSESSMGTVINETLTVESSTSTNIPTGPTSTLTTDGPPGTTLTVVEYTPTITTPSVDVVVTIPDTQPEFEGGLAALYAWMGRNLKYPEIAREIGKEGTVYVKFVVDQNGKVGHLSLLNTAGYGFDEEALRVVGMLPNFKKPGTVSGKAVKVYYHLPIKFRIK
jgi:protein TonB